VKAAAIQLIEAAYRLDLPRPGWLEALAEAAAPLTPEVTGVMAYAFDASRSEDGVVVEDHGTHALDDAFVEATLELNRNTRRNEAELFYGHAVICGTVSEMVGSGDHVRSDDNSYVRTVAKRGFPDSFGVTASAADQRGIVVNAPLTKPRTLDARRRRIWLQLGEHLRTAERLRQRLGVGPPVAVVEPSGRVRHATGPTRDAELRERLVRAVRDIDVARSDRGPDEAHEVVAMWEGVLDGRWSLVENFERDGRRYFIVLENQPGVRDPRALTARERHVVDLVAHGRSNKHIADELDVSLGTVAKLLQRALDKLGLKSRHELIWVQQRLGAG